MSANLICPDCEYSNEPERVYCHNCGAKLDRTLLPKDEDDKKHESPEKARRRIRKMTNPGTNPVTRELRALAMTIFWAAVVAGLVVISRAPDGVPDPKAPLPSRLVQSGLMEALESPTPRTLSFTQEEINQALKQSLRAKDASAIPGVKFERAFVQFNTGVARITNQQSLWGHSVYSSVAYRVEMKDGKFAPTLVAGSFGRLAVHPEAMKYLDFSFKKLWGALKRERDQLQKLQNIIVTKGQVTLVTKGAAPR